MYSFDDWVAENLSSDMLNEQMKNWFAHELDSTIQDKGVFPTLIVFLSPKNLDEKMDVNMILLDMDNFDEDKYSILKTVGTRCVSDGIYPLMALFVSEAWTRNFSDEEDKERRKQKRQVADYADKVECLEALLCTAISKTVLYDTAHPSII
jgi:hypothetical protein